MSTHLPFVTQCDRFTDLQLGDCDRGKLGLLGQGPLSHGAYVISALVWLLSFLRVFKAYYLTTKFKVTFYLFLKKSYKWVIRTGFTAQSGDR